MPGLALVLIGLALVVTAFVWLVTSTPLEQVIDEALAYPLVAGDYLVTWCAGCGEDVWLIDAPDVVAHLRTHAPDAAEVADVALWERELS